MTTSYQNQLHTIDAATLKQWVDQQQVILVDVREPSEFAEGCIPGAKLVPLSKFDPLQIPLADNCTLVLYCRAGGRSAAAAQRLFEAGFDSVTHLDKGIGAWLRAGYPLQTGQNRA